jgi:phosphoglycolate phosphatase
MKIFCDLDGTLIDIAPRHYRVYLETVGIFGGAALPQEQYWDLKRKKTKWPELLRLSRLEPSMEAQFLESFIQKIESIEYLKADQLFPGALETIERLSQQHQCYLVSLRRKYENLLAQLDWLKLSPHFTKVLSGHSESDGYDKKVELIQGELKGSRGAIIGDTEADIVTGKELGLMTLALTSGIRDEQFLVRLEPDYLLKGITEVADLI